MRAMPLGERDRGYSVGRVPRLLAPDRSCKFRERGVERFVFDLDHYGGNTYANTSPAKTRRNVFYYDSSGGSAGNSATAYAPAFFPDFYAGGGNGQRFRVQFFFNASLYSKMQFRMYRTGSSPGNAYFNAGAVPVNAYLETLFGCGDGRGGYTQTKAGAWNAVDPWEYTFNADAGGLWRVIWGSSNDNVYVRLLHVDLYLKDVPRRRIGEENFMA